jgi:hypothetical protein
MARACGVSFVVAATLTAGCSDPVVDDAREALGPEIIGIPEGPLHRAGQPCLLCHDGSGPGDLEMSVAGTVFKYPDSFEPLSGALVDIIDSRGTRHTAATNCAGNFFVQPADFDPVFPLWTTLRFGGAEVQMSSPIYRDGSCATCHDHRPGPASAGHVYFAPTQDIPFPPQGCP